MKEALRHLKRAGQVVLSEADSLRLRTRVARWWDRGIPGLEPWTSGSAPTRGEITRVQSHVAQLLEREPKYWASSNDDDEPYLAPYLVDTRDYLSQHADRSAQILDICGGNGNLGLALRLEGFHDYLLADVEDVRMRWGALVWRHFGWDLRWQREDLRRLSFPAASFDVVTLQGWENPFTPYTYALKEVARVTRAGGLIIFTYHDEEGIVEGGWDFNPARRSSYLAYSISRGALNTLCTRLGLEVVVEQPSRHTESVQPFFPDDRPRAFPQPNVVCRKTG